MQKRVYLIVFVATILTSSCTGYKVIKNWKAENPSMKDKSILVIGRVSKMEIRQAYEDEITKRLVSKGVDAVSSYTKFPNFDPTQKVSEEQSEKIKSIIEENGYNGVILTALKDYQENSREMGQGGYQAAVDYGAMYYPSYYGGFYNYYYNPMSISSDIVYVEKSGSTITSKTYILETVVYNLDLPEDKQLVAWVTASIENPDNAVGTASNYASTILNSFK
ncbi:hypothetical protein [Eudoraea chungangensis]|uniref:hypothetical protein n=1 Tax=Eudoraea chungangensis TaxID=1481905 RepID=UPI0023ED73F3|nr:hypothetical protein [Eudoraea chungangensis]